MLRLLVPLLLLMICPQRMLADDLYVLTSYTLASSGTAGTYTESSVTSDYKFTNTSGTVYTYTVSNLPSGGFYFRLYDASWTRTKEMQPYTNNDPIAINGDSYTISKNCYGSSNAWKVSYTDGAYSSLTITVDLSEKTAMSRLPAQKQAVAVQMMAPRRQMSRDIIYTVQPSTALIRRKR